MAQRLQTNLSPVRCGAPSIYPWPEWMDGNAWRIAHGPDFECSAKSMASQIRERASREGMTASARVLASGDVEFQFYAEPSEERAA